MIKRGPKSKEISRVIRSKLIDLLLMNSESLQNKFTPLNVVEILAKLHEKIPGVKLTRRHLQSILRDLTEQGAIGKIHGKKSRSRERYYFYKSKSPRFFWKETLEPFLQSMKITEGSKSHGSMLLGKTVEKPLRFIGIGKKSAILEDGIDITSKYRMEDDRMDAIGKLNTAVEDVIREELSYYYGISDNISDDSFKALKSRLDGKKLAFIFIIDGSEFMTIPIHTSARNDKSDVSKLE